MNNTEQRQSQHIYQNVWHSIDKRPYMVHDRNMDIICRMGNSHEDLCKVYCYCGLASIYSVAPLSITIEKIFFKLVFTLGACLLDTE